MDRSGSTRDILCNWCCNFSNFTQVTGNSICSNCNHSQGHRTEQKSSIELNWQRHTAANGSERTWAAWDWAALAAAASDWACCSACTLVASAAWTACAACAACADSAKAAAWAACAACEIWAAWACLAATTAWACNQTSSVKGPSSEELNRNELE